MSKVNSIDFEKVEIYKLEKIFDIESFQYSNPIYEDYIKGEAYEDQTSSIAQTWIFVYNNQNVIGYVSCVDSGSALSLVVGSSIGTDSSI